MAKDTLGVSENLAAEKVRSPAAPAITFDEAIELQGNLRKPGVKVKGSRMPFGGAWSYDKDADELTLIEAPTPG